MNLIYLKEISALQMGIALVLAGLNRGSFDRNLDARVRALTFKSKGIRIVRDGELSVEGDLTIHGVTRKVSFAVEGPTPPSKDPWGNTRVAISASTKINRKDFGLTWNAALETGGILVGEEVTITIDAQFVKA